LTGQRFSRRWAKDFSGIHQSRWQYNKVGADQAAAWHNFRAKPTANVPMMRGADMPRTTRSSSTITLQTRHRLWGCLAAREISDSFAVFFGTNRLHFVTIECTPTGRTSSCAKLSAWSGWL
jgi:hypothetical protein